MAEVVEKPEVPTKEPAHASKVRTFQEFEYEFFLCLTKIVSTNRSNSVKHEDRDGFLSERKYYAQAKDLMYWIPTSKHDENFPPFVINLSDLTPNLRSEFKDFCNSNESREIGIFLKEIAARFFENIDYEYTHEFVLRHLKVVVER